MPRRMAYDLVEHQQRFSVLATFVHLLNRAGLEMERFADSTGQLDLRA